MCSYTKPNRLLFVTLYSFLSFTLLLNTLLDLRLWLCVLSFSSPYIASFNSHTHTHNHVTNQQTNTLTEKAKEPPKPKDDKKPAAPAKDDRKPSVVEDKKSAQTTPVPSKPGTPRGSVPSIQVEKEKSPAPGAKAAPGKVPTLKEPTPEPESGGGSRRGSFLGEATPAGSRRGSFLIQNPLEGAKDLLGKPKLAPSRRGSDSRRGSVKDEDDRVDKPSVALNAVPDAPTPPRLYGYSENQSGNEGKTAYITFQVEGNPVPTFKFYKGMTEIFEGGRYTVITDGKKNNEMCFCIRKAKSNDEGTYKIIATNEHGEGKAEITLFVGGEDGMDFRSQLRKKKMVKQQKKDDDPDWGNLKGVDSERKASITATKVSPRIVNPIRCEPPAA